MTWVQTFSGKKFDCCRPDASLVDIEDIAQGLALQTRFNGQISHFYSIAQHSVHVQEHLTELPIEAQLQGLLHDAMEAYIGDMVRPIKRVLPTYRHIEEMIWEAICAKFEMSVEVPAQLIEADNMMLVTEAKSLCTVDRVSEWNIEQTPSPIIRAIDPWSPEISKKRFLARFEQLQAAR